MAGRGRELCPLGQMLAGSQPYSYLTVKHLGCLWLASLRKRLRKVWMPGLYLNSDIRKLASEWRSETRKTETEQGAGRNGCCCGQQRLCQAWRYPEKSVDSGHRCPPRHSNLFLNLLTLAFWGHSLQPSIDWTRPCCRRSPQGDDDRSSCFWDLLSASKTTGTVLRTFPRMWLDKDRRVQGGKDETRYPGCSLLLQGLSVSCLVKEVILVRRCIQFI